MFNVQGSTFNVNGKGKPHRCGEEKTLVLRSGQPLLRRVEKEVIQMRNSSTKWMGVIGEYGPLWAYFLLVLTLCIVASGPAMGASTGTTGATFLKIAVGSRPAAMGNAYTAVAEAPYAMHYNPASIGWTDRWDLSAMHQDQFGQISFDYFGLAAPAIKNRSAWGISMVRQAVTDYARTENDDGAKFTNSDLALTGTYAHQIIKPLTIGFSGKIIKQTLAQYTANGWAVDVGANLRVNPRLSLGASILNIGPKITFISIGDPLPTALRVGGAFKLLPRGNLLATVDYWLPKDDSDGMGFGVEYRPNRFLAFRGGYQLGSDFKGFNASTYGVTFDFENFGMEYAFIPREKLGDVHRAGLNVSFGGKKPQVIASRTARQTRRKESARQTQEPAQSQSARSKPAPSEPPAAYYEPPAQQKTKAAEEEASPSGRSVSDMMALRKATAAPVAPVSEESPKPAAEEVPAEVMKAIEEEKAAMPPESPAAPVVSQPRAASQESKDAGKDAISQEKIAVASNLMKQQRYQEAVTIIRSGLQVAPGNIPLLYLLSESLYKIGEYDQAMEAVNQALSVMHGQSRPNP